MNATQRLLERVRQRLPRDSDYALAQALGISRARVSHYMKGDNQITEETVIARAAQIAQIPLSLALVELCADLAKSPEAQQAWRVILELVSALADSGMS